jgi:hypothetical protein
MAFMMPRTRAAQRRQRSLLKWRNPIAEAIQTAMVVTIQRIKKALMGTNLNTKGARAKDVGKKGVDWRGR